jgi:hypothetical protein
MIPIIIRKRTLSLIAFALIGAALLFLGWRGNLLEKKIDSRNSGNQPGRQ